MASSPSLHARRRLLTDDELDGVPWLRPLTADERDRVAPQLRIGAMQRSLPVWSAFELVKGNARLRITALPGPDDMPALLLDFGDGDYRIVIPAAPIERQAYPLLAQRFPGADLALLLQDGRRVMLPLGSGRAHVFGEEQTVSFRFAKVKR